VRSTRAITFIAAAILLLPSGAAARDGRGVSFMTRPQAGVSSLASTYISSSPALPSTRATDVQSSSSLTAFSDSISHSAPTIVVSQVALHCLSATGTSPSLGPRGTLMGLQCLSVPGLPTLPTKPAKKGKQSKRPRVAPQVLAQVAVDKAIALAGKPGLHISPARVGLTGLDTYFWIAPPPRPLSAQASVPGVTVTAHARPVQFVWRFGDGDHLVTSEPGRPWTRTRPGSIAHQYQTRARYAVSVQVMWIATWRIGGGQWRPLGTFATEAARSFPVRQAVALLTKS
jgi:hypothetical protein